MPKHRWMNYTWAGERNADVRPNIVVIADTKIRDSQASHNQYILGNGTSTSRFVAQR